MKRFQITALLLALLCLLSGCGFISDSYVSVTEHYDPYAYKEETEPGETEPPDEEPLQTVGNYYSMLELLRSFVTEGVEHGQFLFGQFSGDREETLKDAFYAIKYEDPVGAYAIDYIEYSHTQQNNAWLVTVDTVYRRSASEIQAIQSVRGNDRALRQIYDTLDQNGAAVTLQISGYQDEDFAARIRAYCLEHPNTVVELPEISVAVYPESGNVRIAELHFTYETDKETLRGMQAEAESVLSSAERYAQYAPDDATKLSLIYSYLTSRFRYSEDEENGSVYRLLCEGVGNSESFSSVAAYLCRRVGLDCLLVEGSRTRGETPASASDLAEEDESENRYVWVIVCIDGYYYHWDVQQDALDGLQECRLLLDAEMEGYDWDREAFPVCDGVTVKQEEP